MVLQAAPWPVQLWPSRCDFHLENQSSSGGVSILGNEQVIVAPSARWRAKLSIPIMHEATTLAYRAFVAALGGRAGTALAPTWSVYRTRDANGRRFGGNRDAAWGGDLEQDGVAFDLSGFGQDDTPVYASLAAPAALNATQIAVDYAPGIDGLRPGQYFSIGHRLYMVTQTWQVDDDAPTQIRFSPWLREDVDQGAPVIIDRPVCLMRFAQDVTGELELDLGRWGQGQLEFVEAW